MVELNKELINSNAGKEFIIKTVEYFINRSRNNLKDSPFKTLDNYNSIKLYKDYLDILKLIKENSVYTEDIYNLFIYRACRYLIYTEDGLDYRHSQPYEGLYLFDLVNWYNNISPEDFTLEEQFILIINKLSKSYFYNLKF